jgi:hypothetical protein
LKIQLSNIIYCNTYPDDSDVDSDTSPFAPNMPAPNVPKPGPANLSARAGLPEWLEEAKQCHYLPETVMKQLCEMVKECLMEGEFCQIYMRGEHL